MRTLLKEELAGVSKLMDRAWSANYGKDGYFRYEPGILERQFENEEGSIWLGAYVNDELAGVNVSFPRKIKIQGTTTEATIPTYLSVLPEWRRNGIASTLAREIVKRNRRTGIEKILPYFDDEGWGKSVYKKCYPGMFRIRKSSWLGKIIDHDTFSKSVGYDIPARKIVGGKLKMGFLGAEKGGIAALINKGLENLHPITPGYSGDSLIDPTDTNSILELAEPIFPWERVWTPDEFGRELNDPDSITAGYRLHGELCTIVHFKIRTLVTRKPVKVAWFDWIYGRKGIKRALVDALSMAKDKGVVLSLVPKMGYFSTLPFLKAGFIPFPKGYELHCISLHGNPPDPAKKVRLDVR